MTGEKLVHVIFNTGAREEIMRRNFKFPHLERANLDWVIKNAKNTAGVDIDENIILQLRASTITKQYFITVHIPTRKLS